MIAPGSLRPRKGDKTRENILSTAERLFSERGIEAVSVRTILAEAGVNVALAHRYFGGRDGLIDEVLRRALGPLNDRRLLLLEEVEARGDRSTVEDVLRALFAPSIRWLFEQPDRARLLAQLQTANDPKLRALHRQHFDAPLQRFAEAMVRTVVPHLEPLEFVTRFTFAHGALQAVYRHGLEVARLARERLGPSAVPGERDWVEQIVAFCAAGLRAQVAPVNVHSVGDSATQTSSGSSRQAKHTTSSGLSRQSKRTTSSGSSRQSKRTTSSGSSRQSKRMTSSGSSDSEVVVDRLGKEARKQR